jgi:hypothetical protein
MSESSAQRTLSARIGTPSAAGNPEQAVVSIVQEAAGYRAQIAFSGTLSGTRELRAARCDSLSDAVLVIVAITAGARSEATRVEPVELHWQLYATLSADFGSLPQPTIGPGVQLGIALARVSLAFSFEYWLSRERLLPAQTGTGAEVGLWNVGMDAAIAVVQLGRLDFGPMLSVVGGSAYGKPLNLGRPRPIQRVPWLGSLFGLQGRLAVASFTFRATAELGACIAQPQFTVSDPNEVLFHSARVFGRVGLGIGWTFR